MSDPKMVDLWFPIIGTWKVPTDYALLAALGMLTFVVFFLADPFRIIEKVDLRLVRLYKAPENSSVKGKSFLCIVNPYSGSKEGLFQFYKVAFPMLKKAGAKDVKLVKTERAGHFEELGASLAKQILKKGSLDTDGVLVFGGDGSLTELLNGAVKEASKETMNLDDENVKTVLSKLPIAHLPCGTANGIAASNGATTCYQSLLEIIEGSSKPYDMNQVTLRGKGKDGKPEQETKRLDAHCVSWGIIADHDSLTESESWRKLGKTLKLILAPIVVIARRRTYRGKVSFRPVKLEANEFAKLADAQGYSDASELADDDDQGLGWKKIEGEFILVTASVLSWAADDVAICPDVKFHDGHMGLLIVRGNTSRLDLIRSFIAMGDGSAPKKMKCVELYKVDALRIQAEEEGSMSSTGMDITDKSDMQVDLFPGIGRYLMK